MTSLNALKARLISEATYQSSEQFDAKLDGWIKDALTQHNPTYTYETLPTQEEILVIILAWISLCYARASKFVNAGNSAGAAGYGADRDTPYQKNMNMALSLQKRYDSIVSNLQDSGPGQSILQGNLVIKSQQRDVIVGNSPAVSVFATYSDLTATAVTISWNYAYNEFVADVYVYVKDTPGVYQAWNMNTSDGVSFHAEAATQVAKIQSGQLTASRFISLTPETPYYFAVVVKMLSGQFYYSNEVMVLTPHA